MSRFIFLACLGLALPSQAADLAQIPAIVAGKKPKGADWKAAAALEKIVQQAASKAGHNLTALTGDAGKKALACKGNVDCLAKIAAGRTGFAVVIVVWALKNKRLGEVALFDLSTMKKIGGANGPIDAKLGAVLVAAIPAAVETVKEEPAVTVAATEPAAAVATVSAGEEAWALRQKLQAKPEEVVEPAPKAEQAQPEAPKVASDAPAATAKNNNLAYGLIGGGLALIGGGSFFGMKAWYAHAELAKLAEGGERTDKITTMEENALLADVLFWPGLVCAGSGAYLLLK
jgi:hypothetical protein